MIRHFLKLVWNRKRSSALLVLEIVVSFAALFALMLEIVQIYERYSEPLGFKHENRWRLNVRFNAAELPFMVGANQDTSMLALQSSQSSAVRAALNDIPEIDGIAGIMAAPYSGSTIAVGLGLKGRDAFAVVNSASHRLADVLGLDVVQGRWFRADDHALAYAPLVINKAYYEEFIAPEEPLGYTVNPDGEGMKQRIVGVVSGFRYNGEFSDNEPLFFDYAAENTESYVLPRSLILKLRYVPPDFEYRLVQRLAQVAPSYTFQLSPLEALRAAHFSDHLLPVLLLSAVALFLLLMVGFGLLGVLWQNVSRRTREIGLRRALGASLRHVTRQIIGENIVLASFGVAIGGLIIVQFPLLGLLQAGPGSYAKAFVLSSFVIYMLAITSAWYPARLAGRVQAREALQYE